LSLTTCRQGSRISERLRFEYVKVEGVRNTLKRWKEVGEVNETRTLAVSGSGGGLYLYLPKPLCELYKITAGDKIKAVLRAHYKRDYAEEEKGEDGKGPHDESQEGGL
jgi:hypothetical protein